MGEDAIRGGDRSHARRRLTVAQAADQLGVTVDAVRARIKRGTIDHVKEGPRVYVMLGDDQGDTRHDQDSAQATDHPPEAGPAHRDELLEELRGRVRSLERQLDGEREANRENRRIIAALTSRIPQLEAPRDEPQARDTASESPEGTEAPADVAGSQESVERRSSWWRRLFGE